ncbi:MAG: AAA family ATPase [Selenomonadaceae bacterium]|nr:AAA family ATPase [Selenomonadaceae bacterium]
MLFFDFNVAFQSSKTNLINQQKMKSKGQFVSYIRELNDILTSDQIDDNIQAFIYQENSGKLSILAAVDQLQKPSTEKLQNFLIKKLETPYGVKEVEVSDLREITVDTFRKLLNRGDRINFVDEYRISDDLRINFDGNRDFDVAEEICPLKRINHQQALQQAHKIMADQTLIDEFTRIYSKDNNRKKFYGHPVHYKILAGSYFAAMKIVELLSAALYTNKRLVSHRITRIHNITERCYAESDFENLFKRAAGSTVVIELQGAQDNDTNYATSYEEVVDFISEVVKKYQRNTLCIFVEMVDQPGFAPKLISSIQDDINLIELQEGAGNREQALDYLKFIKDSSDMSYYSDDDLERALGDKMSFRASDIHQISDKLYSDGLKNKIYPAYKKVDYFTLSEEEANKDDAYHVLQKMIGLTEQKKTLKQIMASFKIQKRRAELGLTRCKPSRHMCFTGNPGSAKTTVARLFADILSKEGILTTGRFIECGRADLVGKYVGWTANIVQKKFRQAKGGVLFIDEAYSLVEHWAGSYGDEAISTIVQEMENHRDDVIVIFAGYNDKMKSFLDRNEGLLSRIAFHLNFPDYNTNELIDILKLMAENKGYVLKDDVLDECKSIFNKAIKQDNFGNGRFVRNLLEQAEMKQAQRIYDNSVGKEIDKETLMSLSVEDFKDGLSEIYKRSRNKIIGFTN